MPCDGSWIKDELERQQRIADAQAAIDALERELAGLQVTVRVSADGAIAFDGWDATRNGVTDTCAYYALTNRGSAAFAAALQAAEQACGYTHNPAAIEAGVHSHDGGRTWARH